MISVLEGEAVAPLYPEERQGGSRAAQEQFWSENILGTSPGMRDVRFKVRQVATTETTVLIRGESGTGNDLVATVIHDSGRRAHKPLVKVRCAALSETVLDSELFGLETDISNAAGPGGIGRVESADESTLLLDEIGDLPPATQVKLLRLLQEHEFDHVGGNRVLRANVRVIATTSQDLERQVEAGALRADLYYQINVFPIFLPPLQQRKEDIPLLAGHFASKYANMTRKEVRHISSRAINAMFAHHWPGNVRELENCMQCAVLLSSDGVIHAHDLPPALHACGLARASGGSLFKVRLDLVAKDMLIEALQATGGSVTAAARQLGLTPRMTRYKIKRLGIDYRQFGKKPRS
jgi:Nif-specific regulatory protein